MSRRSKTRYTNLNNSLASIIVPTYNRKWLLPRTLQSLVNQSYENIEILLINDCGEDVQEVVDKFNDPRIKYLQNSKNVGLAATRNVGLKNANGSHFCLCDDDDIYAKYAIEFRLYMAKKLNEDIVYTRSLLDHWEKREERYISVGKTLYWDAYFNKDAILISNISPCCNVLWNRKAWDSVDNYLFDETLSTTEDVDFWISLSRKNNFERLELIDTECSVRNDKSQMTNNRNFLPDQIKVFKKWRHTAMDIQKVTEAQNNYLISLGINPADYDL
jgi:glycosyltransferase involved in cell wall biosynthesis